MEIIKREDITDEYYREILDVETHHNHEIIKDEQGTLRWKENPTVELLRKNISLNDLCPLLSVLGYGKNSEVYRKLYRDMGYSLFGYWEIFYWEVNNEEASEYVPNGVITNLQITQALDRLSDKERHEIISEYCSYCGSSERCQCWNDD